MKYTPENVLKEDPYNMAGDIYDFIDDLNSAMETPIEYEQEFDDVIICGMGGSAISGDVLADCMFGSSKYPVTVQRFPELPEWVDERTLIIMASYSGNTRETLALYDEVNKKGYRMVAITAGGRLLERATSDENYILKMKEGIQPRCATGYSLGLMFALMDQIGDTSLQTMVKRQTPKLKKFRDELASNRSMAWEVARRIDGRTPIIYSTVELSSTATRWKSQINENSKMMAFSGLMPEFNYNDVSGWSAGSVRESCVPLFLCEEKMPKVRKKAMYAAIDVLKTYDTEPMVVRIRGRSVVEKLLRSIMIGDYVSLYLAYLNGVDPSEVASISELKTRLADLLPYPKAWSKKKK